MRQYAKLKRENVLTVNMQQRDFTVKFVLKGGTATQRKSPKHISISTENHYSLFFILRLLLIFSLSIFNYSEDGYNIPCQECRCPNTQRSGHSFADRCSLEVNEDNSTSAVCECKEEYKGMYDFMG